MNIKQFALLLGLTTALLVIIATTVILIHTSGNHIPANVLNDCTSEIVGNCIVK